MVEIRPATLEDVPALAALNSDHMRELFHCAWTGSAAALARDGFGLCFEFVVAARGDAVVGFVAWQRDYDLHNCIPGAELMDMYVAPSLRGLGVALQLVAAVAATSRTRGGTYVRGLTTGDPNTRRTYERLAIAFDADNCIVGGRAFRVLADLAGKPARSIVRGLPDKAANWEP